MTDSQDCTNTVINADLQAQQGWSIIKVTRAHRKRTPCN